jgi:hypothetical protein
MVLRMAMPHPIDLDTQVSEVRMVGYARPAILRFTKEQKDGK